MSIEGALVFFDLLQFLVERSKEFSFLCQVVVGPLAWEWEDECVLLILVSISGGGAPVFASGGRTILWKRREFDSTMGFPGEDGRA